MNIYKYALIFYVFISFFVTANAGLTTIADRYDQAIGFPAGYWYESLTNAFINNNGEVFFSSTALGEIQSGLNCEETHNPGQQSCEAIWIGKPDALKTAIKQGEQINGFPVNSVFDTYFTGMGILCDSGLLGFVGHVKMAGNTVLAIMAHLNGVNHGIVYYGQKAPGFPLGTTFQDIDQTFRLSNAGLGFMGKVDNEIKAIWFWDKSNLKLIAAEEQEVGDLFPGCAVISTPLSPQLLDISNAGEVLFLANFDADDENCPKGGLFTWKDGSYKAIAIDGDSRKNIGVPGGTSFSFTMPYIYGFSGEINNNGDVLFSARLLNDNFAVNGIGQYESVWIAKNNGNIRPVLFAGEDIPELPHTQTSGILYQGNSGVNDKGVAIINTDTYNRATDIIDVGDVILVGKAKTESYQSFDEVENSTASNLKAIVYTGAPASVMGENWIFSSIGEAILNNNNVIAFNAQISHPDEQYTKHGVWMMDAQGNLELIAIIGEPMIIEGEAINFFNIQEISASNSYVFNDFQRRRLNDNNQFIFEGDTGIYLYDSNLASNATPTSAPSPTPEPGSGVISTASAQAIELVQKAYLAYYGRPGDPAGIDYWAQKLDATGSNWTKEILNAFGNSEEFQTRFGGLSHEDLINNIYSQLFNRQAEKAGLDFFVNLLQSGQSSLSQIAVDILNGAVGDDASSIKNKLIIADYFTQKVADGLIIYDSIDEIKTVLWMVAGGEPENNGSIAVAKEAIDAIATRYAYQ